MVASPITFSLPPTLHAAAPPERRGLRRDHVRLLVLDRQTGAMVHSRFDRIGDFLAPGDLLVLNNSRTLPAILQATGPSGLRVEVRLSRQVDGPNWLALLEESGGAGSDPGGLHPGALLRMADGLTATVLHHDPAEPLSLIRFARQGEELFDTLYRIGEPVRYEYIHQPWSLDYYQTVYASAPGSVEMPSAGRAFTWELLLRLQRRGIGIAYLSLHAGLSYYGARWRKDPRDVPEAYTIPLTTAVAIQRTKQAGRRVIAVGTTVVRALESAAALDGTLLSQQGAASAYIGPGYPLKLVDGLLTGWHEPEASHLDMLSAFADPTLLASAYRLAVEEGYLWHEFGDANLIL